MKYDDIDMKIDREFKTPARKKVMYQNYALGKRIWEMEQCFNEAIKAQDPHHAEYYHRKVNKLYKEAGIREN